MKEPIMPPRGRSAVELRKLGITRRYTRHAEGSALIECGDTKVICTASIDEKVLPFNVSQGKAIDWRMADPGPCRSSVGRGVSRRTGA